MPDDDREPVINDFGAIADIYDELVDWAPYARWIADLEPRLVRHGLAPGARILDAACGTGLSTLPWLERGYRVTATDGSPPMLERARRRIRDAGHNAPLLHRDLLHLDFHAEFDMALCMHSGLDYLLETADLAAAFRSLRGCLVAGGLLAFDKCLDEPAFYREDYGNMRRLSCGAADFDYHWDREHGMLVQRCTVIRRDGSLPMRSEFVYCLKATPPDELRAMVEAAGFRELEPLKQFTVLDPGIGIFRAV